MRKRLILVVDDNKINRTLLTQILLPKYRVHSVEDGLKALEYLKENYNEVSAILLDLNMPVLNGYEFLKTRKEFPPYCNIPVIVQTTYEGYDTELACLEMGANDFLIKPYSPKIILKRLENIISLKESENFIISVQYDTLTGLFNKEGFLAQARVDLKNRLDIDYTLLCFDIDRFKTINQFAGQANGDKVLIFVADILRDVFKENSIIARFSGDRFYVLTPSPVDEVYMDKVFLKHKENQPVNLPINVQSGCYNIEDRSIELTTMIDWAMIALDKIKGQYNKYCSTFTKEMKKGVEKEQFIVSQMDMAVSQEQFVVYYQPKWDIINNKIIGAEALVRWIHPQYGFMNPGEFIPIFEKNGFITKLDLYVWDKVCKQIREWMDQKLDVVPVSVNVSRHDIYSKDLLFNLQNLISKYNLSTDQLHLEITETAYAQSYDELYVVLSELSENGFIIEMDDFGSGYSSLSMLSSISVNTIKLDLLFLNKKNADSKNNKSVIRLIVNIAKELDLELIAEGVETKEEVEYLKKVGCTKAQGFYYAKPMKATDFAKLLKN